MISNIMAPWPRKLINFPIILIAIVQQYIWAAAILWDDSAIGVTAVNILAKFLPPLVIVGALLSVASLAASGFFMKRRMLNLLSLVPQQFILFLSAGGALEAMLLGRFADGVERAQAFLVADQCSALLIAFFHTWALFLILKYAED